MLSYSVNRMGGGGSYPCKELTFKVSVRLKPTVYEVGGKYVSHQTTTTSH